MTTITALTDLSKLPNQSQDQAVFDANFAYLVENLPLRAQQENALAANLNSIAAGGAYAIPYTFNGNASVGGGTGRLSVWDSGTVHDAVKVGFDASDSRGINIKSLMDAMFFTANTSSVKGFIKISKQNDPTRWAVFSVSQWVHFPNNGFPYGTLDVVCVGYSHTSPFVTGDALVMQCQRTGDKGDAGSLTPVLWVRDVKGSGQSAGTTANTQRRTLNTVKRNTIPGASLSGDVITVPPGTYRLSASAPAYSSGRHRAYASITVGGVTTLIEGQTANGSAPSAIQMSEFLAVSTASISIQHMFDTWNVPNGLGLSLGLGGEEVYTDVFIEKVS